MNLSRWIYPLLLCCALMWGPLRITHFSYAQDHAEEVSDSSDEAEKNEVKESPVRAPIAKDIPRLQRKPKVIEGVSRTKYTSNSTEAQADKVTEVMAVGISKIIDINYPGALRKEDISIGNVQILTVESVSIKGKNRLIINPLAKGETSIQIRDPKTQDVPIIIYAVVTEQNLYRVYSDLKDSLKEVEGIQIKIDGNRVLLTGEVYTPNDYGIVANVISDPALAGLISNRITMSPISLSALAKRIETDIQAFAPTVVTSVLNGKIILEGTVDSEGLKARALKRAEWYLPEVKLINPIEKDSENTAKSDKPIQIIQNDIVVEAPPPKRDNKLVKINAHFVELNKDFLKAFGFKWQPGFTADPSISIGTSEAGSATSSAAGGFTFSGTLSSLFPALNSMQNAGYGRVLKSATAIVKSKEKLKIGDTQQIPSQTIGSNGAIASGPPTTVGFSLEVTPTIMQGDDVDISFSMSQVNVVGRGAGNAPITANHNVDSRIYLKSGEVAAVTGISGQDVTTSFNRDDPKAGAFASGGNGPSTTPLWTLLRSKNFTKKKSQFVVFLSPQVIDSASEGTKELKNNFRIKSNQ